MSRHPFVGAVAAAFVLLAVAPPTAWAIDHDNIDAGRPLRFEDADSIAFRERAFETGVALGVPRRGSSELGLTAEYLMGSALNTHFSLDFDPSVAQRRFDAGNVGVGVFRSLNRETLGTPAFALRADAFLPTGRDARGGTDLRLRGILSKTVRQYGRLHANADAHLRSRPGSGERSVVPAVTLGYSRPLGFPTRFDRTGLLEAALRGGDRGGAVATVGAGLRQQVTVRSVFDVGLEADVASWRGAPRESVRLVAGYSTAF